ncbi:MAG: recombinase family protein [Chloroflexi bacterium]|nr:recombinase family protein [Chloroflexota bacterium]
MRTIIYSRVSTDAQADGTSLDTQERASLEYGREAGYSVIRAIRDTASGASLERPGIAEVRRLMREGECDVLIGYALDRLSRDQNHVGVLLAEAEDAGVRIELVTESFEDTAIGKFIVAARAFTAEVEREKIAERTMRGKEERARNGQIPQGTGAGCFGYVYVHETGRRVLNAAQAPVVKRIFENFASGKGCNRIATELNAEGVPTLGGNQWYPVTITRILKNETYTGRTVYRRTKRVKVRRPGRARRVERRIEQDPSNHIVIEGASPQIVTQDLFERVQARFADRERQANRAPSRSYPLRGRLRCGHCGAGMVGQSVQHGRYFYYRCNRLYLSDAEKRCSSRQIRKDALETAVLGAIEGVLANPELAVGMAERLRVGTDHGARLAALGGEISHLDESQDRLVDLYTDGEVTRDVYEQKRNRLANRKTTLERERAQLRSESAPGPDPELLRERMPEVLQFIREWVREADGDELTLLLQALEVRVDVSLEEADVRVEVPMIGGEKGADFVTIERTSA